MKTTYKYLLLAGLVVLAASCEKEIEKESPADATTGKMITETISAQIEGETKATVDADAKFAWSLGDNIAVHVTKGNSHLYVDTVSGASEEAASASFSVSYGEGFSRDAFAIFPSTIVAGNAANYGQSGSPLDITLPASYSLSTVTGEKTRCPMIASNTGSSWTFRQLCGLLRLTVNSIPSDATSIKIQFPGKKVNGAFSIAYPVTLGTSTIASTPAVNEGDDIITITGIGSNTSVTVNLPLPTGDYDDVFITPVGSSTKVAALRHIGYTAQAAHGKKLTAALVAFVGAGGEHYVFAPGNLQYIGSAAEPYWKFADRQYIYLYDSTAQQGSADSNVDRDLFGWGTAGWDNSVSEPSWTNYQPWSTSKDDLYNVSEEVKDEKYINNIYGYGPVSPNGLLNNGVDHDYSNGDWGIRNPIGPYAAGVWHTPSGADFAAMATPTTYGRAIVFTNNRPTTSKSKKHYGIVIIPTVGWVDPLTTTKYNEIGNAFTCGDREDKGKGNTTTWGTAPDEATTATNYYANEEAWQAMEDAGAIFLPAAGYRTGTVVDKLNSYGNYWSSTAITDGTDNEKSRSQSLDFYSSTNSEIYSPGAGKRMTGKAVRLIRKL